MAFVPNTDKDRKEMLSAIGVNSFEELIANIPTDLRVQGEFCFKPQLSELEAAMHIKSLAAKNATTETHTCFMGGGAYDHFIPAVVGSVLERPEFKTAYTPYQAEVSQGTLQVMYEYQSCICALTGMDVSNASQYDGASGLAESAMLAQSHTKRNNIILAGQVNPNYIITSRTITEGLGIEFSEVKAADGTCDLSKLEATVDNTVAAVVVSQPNFFGNIEDVKAIQAIASKAGALFIVIFNPISLGILEAPGNYEADIAIAEGQPLGISLNFGGPYLGIFTAKDKYLRKMPGRLCGVTEDADGTRCYVLTLQTREQQIKREKATSNICTNQGLMMLASTVYMETMGKEGIKEVAEQCLQKAHYLAKQITSIPGYKLISDKPFYNEFRISTPKPVSEILDKAFENGVLAGIDVASIIDGENGLLIAVTEKRTKAEMDKLVEFLKNV